MIEIDTQQKQEIKLVKKLKLNTVPTVNADSTPDIAYAKTW